MTPGYVNPVNLCEPLEPKGSHDKTTRSNGDRTHRVNLVNLFYTWYKGSVTARFTRCDRRYTPALPHAEKRFTGFTLLPYRIPVRGFSGVNLSSQRYTPGSRGSRLTPMKGGVTTPPEANRPVTLALSGSSTRFFLGHTMHGKPFLSASPIPSFRTDA